MAVMVMVAVAVAVAVAVLTDQISWIMHQVRVSSVADANTRTS